MRAFLCSIDDIIWDVVDIGWTRPKATKSTWDKAAPMASNVNALSQEKTTQMVGFIKDKQPKGLWFVKERQHKLTKVRRVKGESSNMCINTLECLDP